MLVDYSVPCVAPEKRIKFYPIPHVTLLAPGYMRYSPPKVKNLPMEITFFFSVRQEVEL